MKEPSVSDSLLGHSSLLEPSAVMDSGPTSPMESVPNFSVEDTTQDGEAPKKSVLELIGLEDLEEQSALPGTQAFESAENEKTREAMLALRAALREVSEELSGLQRRWDLHVDEERRLEKGEDLTDQDLPRLRAKLFLTERARDEAQNQQNELVLARDDALAGQRRTEAQLREQRGQQQELQRRLRHRELELQELRGTAANDQSISCIYIGSDEDVEEDLGQVSIDSAVVDAIPSQYVTKAEALAALEQLQEQLDEERGRIAELQRVRGMEQQRMRRAGEERERRKEQLFAMQAEQAKQKRAQGIRASGSAPRLRAS